MKKIVLILVLFSLGTFFVFSQDVLSIVRKIDNDQVYDSIKFDGEMTIHYSGKKYVKTFYGIAQGSKNSFFEFTNSDDAGTKYLKKEGNVYVYSPDTEEVIPITGHMLKESMMGSDMSYEDAINNDTLESLYNASIVGSEEINGKQCWIIEFIGKKKTISYPKQKMWVDKETNIPVISEKYALSGAKLKEERILEFKKIGNRNFPVLSEVKDLLRRDSKTIFKMDNIQLDIKIPAGTFSMKQLEK
jgi:outer membrane lipoprotein-sorting protein